MSEPMQTRTSLAVLAALATLAAPGAPAAADDDPLDAPPDGQWSPPGEEPESGERSGERGGGPVVRHFHVGGGIAPLVWMPANNPLSVRFELELRWTPAPLWSVVADLSYIQIGEAGTPLAEDGLDLWAGGMREWAVGDAAEARFFPHVRAGLVFEATSTKRASSAKFIALRAGPGIDWNIFAAARLNLDLELGMGLLSIKAGSEGDSALFELTLGLALRLLWGF
jgi:hypothetical protein